MSLHEVSNVTDVDQQTKGGSISEDQWPSIKKKLLYQMAIEVQQPCLMIRLGQREIKLMKIKWMEYPVEEESSLRRVGIQGSSIEGKGMIKKCSTIEDIPFSNKNRVAVEEELAQFNNLFKMLLSIHKEYS